MTDKEATAEAKEYPAYQPINQAANIANKERIIAIMQQVLGALEAELNEAIRAGYHTDASLTSISRTRSTNWAILARWLSSSGSRCAIRSQMPRGVTIFWRAVSIVTPRWLAALAITLAPSKMTGSAFQRRAVWSRCPTRRGTNCAMERSPAATSSSIFSSCYNLTETFWFFLYLLQG